MNGSANKLTRVDESQVQNVVPRPAVAAAIRMRFHLVFVAAVLIVSFFYGLAAGLRTSAVAVFAPDSGPGQALERHSLLRDMTPDGVIIGEVGDHLTVNGRETDMFSFVSNRNLEDLMRDQVTRWEGQGLYAGGVVANQRGTAFAIDLESGMRFSFTAWSVPEDRRNDLSSGFPVQGVAGQLGGVELKGDKNEINSVPGIPQPFGVKIGTIVGSDDFEGHSYTGTYTSAGNIEKTMRFYSDSLIRQGWRQTESKPGEITGFQKFEKPGTAVSLMFAETPRDGNSPVETVVTVVRIDTANSRSADFKTGGTQLRAELSAGTARIKADSQ
jgi:hypothetical protein